MSENLNELSQAQQTEQLAILKERFENNMTRHEKLEWAKVEAKLVANPTKLWSLYEMERTEGEPDIVMYDEASDCYTFFDCAAETPKGRRSICYDQEALVARKKFPPANSAVNMATEMGIALLTEQQYRYLQTVGAFDLKTSSWIQTPHDIRKLGGALFCDRRYDTVFLYHNGADSYYGVRGFRGSLTV